MAIVVKFFASLRESLDLAEAQVDPSQAKTVADVWQVATDHAAMPPNTLIAINMEYVDKSQNVTDGDEVAFFPPVSGG